MRTATDFLIDISDNMTKKLPIAQKAIKEEIIPLLDFSNSIGMRTFISIAKSPIVINSIDLGATTKQEFTEKIEKLPIPNAGSPIGYTVKQSLEFLNGVEADRKRIILVTAGVETDGGNYEFEVEKNLKVDNVQVNIIGLGLSGFEEKTAQKTADMSYGCFCNIPLDKGDDSLAISSILQPLKDILNGKEVIPTPAPEPEPAPSPVPEPAPVPEPVVEQKPEPKVEVEPVAEPVGVKVEKPQPVAPAVEVKKVQEFVVPDRGNTQFKEQPATRLEAFSADSAASGVQTLDENNAQIEKLLKQNAQSFAQKQAESDKKIAELREAGQQAVATIEELKALNNNANGVIDRLEKSLAQAQAEIQKLTEANASAQAEIARLRKLDEEVVVSLNAEEIAKNSQKCESQVNELLQKRYPGRVVWANQTAKQRLGYDFEVKFDEATVEYFITVKGLTDDKSFFLTQEEWAKCLENSAKYQLYLVTKENKVFVIDNLVANVLNGKVKPLANCNRKVKAGRVQFSIA